MHRFLEPGNGDKRSAVTKPEKSFEFTSTQRRETIDREVYTMD